MLQIYFILYIRLLILAKSEIFVNFYDTAETLGPFPTTRFSELMGNFSSSCEINAQASLLLATENPCKSSTFQRNFTDFVVITSDLQDYGCFEEVSYKNLENLGAIAILNSDPRPAGLPMFRSHIGYTKNDNNANLNFFLDVHLRIVQTQENIIVEINNCADENLHEKCYFIAEFLYDGVFLLIVLYNIYLTITSLKKITLTEGTKPRRFILEYFIFSLYKFAIISIFNLTTGDGYVWIVGGNYKSDIYFFLLGFSANLFFLEHLFQLIIGFF
eukprot:snap_masked-scaffold_19-processed-gene-3.41-mRNA-1 protein AED:1.00 eAED:1.00 QI:0/0/0/0/1/1/2/0/272